MRLLVIAPYFTPYENPRAFRWTSIVQEWVQQGIEVDVLSSQHQNFATETQEGSLRVFRAGFNSAKEAFSNLKNEEKSAPGTGKHSAIPYRINQLFLKPFYWPDDAWIWYRPALKKARSLIASNRYDGLISVSLPFTAHRIAGELKESNPNLFWLADIGDPFSLQPDHPINNAWLWNSRNRAAEKKLITMANRLVFTNNGALELYKRFQPGAVEKYSVIPPMANFPAGRTSQGNKDKIQLGYFGSFFQNIREPAPLLNAFSELLSEFPDMRSKLEFHFYGDLFFPFQKLFADQQLFQVHGALSRKETAEKIQEMDYLILLGNTTSFQLPSKCADYYVSGKSILHFAQVPEDPCFGFLADHPATFSLSIGPKGVDHNALQKVLASEIRPIKTHTDHLYPPAIANAYRQLLPVKD